MVQRETSKLRVGSVFRDIYFPYWGTIAQGITTASQDLGFELVLPLNTAEADSECAAVAQELLEYKPDVVLVQQNVLQHAPDFLNQLRRADIPAIGVECKPDPLFNAVVYADEAQGTIQVLSHLFEKMNYSGKLVNIHGAHIRIRQGTLKTFLPEYPDIELVYEAPGYWSEEDGYRIMQEALRLHPDVTGVFAHNDFMAVGACKAIQEAGLTEQICVVGFDADPVGIQAIYQDLLSATVYRQLYNVGYRAVEAARDILYYSDAPQNICMPTQLIHKGNLIDATIDTIKTLPDLLRTLILNTQEQRRLQQETIDAQRRIIHDLSTPVIPLSKDVLIMPLIGLIDSTRAQQIMDSMLLAVRDNSASFVIVDITGISMIDTQIAHHLIQSARAVQLLGAEVLLVGINPEVAQSLVGLGIEFNAITTRSTLQEALRYSQHKLKRPLL